MIKMPSPIRPQHALAQLEPEEFHSADAASHYEIETVDSIIASIHSQAREDRHVNFAPQPESARPKTVASQVISPGLVVSTEETAIRVELELELLKSGYPLHHVSCHCDESTLLLSGHVRRYYYLQVTLQFAVRFAGGRRIVNRIEVRDHLAEELGQVDSNF